MVQNKSKLPAICSSYQKEKWYLFLTDWQKKLVEVSFELVDQHSLKNSQNLPDYSFLVFSISKAYEGFLKKFLFEMELIDKKTYEGRRFRIGRALNPHVAPHQRDEDWLFDDIAKVCSVATAQKLWDAWLHCRNRVFHFFPKDKGLLTFSAAVARIKEVCQAMNAAVECYLSF